MPRKGFIQVSLTIPETWKEELQKRARLMSVHENETINYIDMIRRAIQNAYDLEDPTDN